MPGQLYDRKLNYALILLLFALITYSAIGFTVELPPVQADAGPATLEPVVDAPMRGSDGSALPMRPLPAPLK
jgi:hypothetical protein